jgi:hypothetical protein
VAPPGGGGWTFNEEINVLLKPKFESRAVQPDFIINGLFPTVHPDVLTSTVTLTSTSNASPR